MNATVQAPSIPPLVRPPATRAITIAILAMGGEGGGVLADWIVDLAEQGGYLAQTTSVPGVAQRTGATIYYLELFPKASLGAFGREPVLALMPVPGEVDVVLASELMEAARAVQREFVTPERTTLIASNHRVYSMTEKMATGDGRVDAAKLLEAAQTGAKLFVQADFSRIAESTGSVISAAMFGALAGVNILPFRREQFEQAIERGGLGVASSLAGFAAGFDAATNRDVEKADAAKSTQPKCGAGLQNLVSQIENDFPAASHDILLPAIQRLADYQDERYAAEYIAMLIPVRDADARYGAGNCELLRETARYLALWMTYEDASRVADLKIRRSRFERIRQGSRAGATQLVQINEFLYPRAEEIADVLPAPIGRWLMNAGRARHLIERLGRGGQIVQTTSLRGFIKLYLVAELRRWRRASLRFAREKEKIGQWLGIIPATAAEDYALALELAECPRLLKGYGDTRTRGERNFDAVMSALEHLRGKAKAAMHMRRLREAALADDSGDKFAEALLEVAA